MEPVIVSSAAAASGPVSGWPDVAAGIGWLLTFSWIVFMIVREYFIDWRRSRRRHRGSDG